MFENNKKYFAFNIWDQDSIKAVIAAGSNCSFDVILQTSSRIFEKMEPELIRAFVSSYSDKTQIKAYLHLDHCRDFEIIKMAIDCGWDSVMIDASNLPLKDNINITNCVCDYAHKKGVLVEAEVGQIQGVEDNISYDIEGIADIADIKEFLENTDIDTFAAAIGTSHGLYKKLPHIRYDLIEQIGEITKKPFVVHGGSGLNDLELMRLLSLTNVRKINISTELKQAYRTGILYAEKKGLLNFDGFDVSAVKKEIHNSIQSVAEHKLRLLGGNNHENDTCS